MSRLYSFEIELINPYIDKNETVMIRKILKQKFEPYGFNVTKDVSLINGGIEISSSYNKMKTEPFIKLFHFLFKHGYGANNTCGYHIHADIRNELMKTKDYLLLFKQIFKRILMIQDKDFNGVIKHTLHKRRFPKLYLEKIIESKHFGEMVIKYLDMTGTLDIPIDELKEILEYDDPLFQLDIASQYLWKKLAFHQFWIEFTPALKYILKVSKKLVDDYNKENPGEALGSIEFRTGMPKGLYIDYMKNNNVNPDRAILILLKWMYKVKEFMALLIENLEVDKLEA